MANHIAVVDDVTCSSVARIIMGHGVPTDEEDSSINGFTIAQLANFYFLLVGICHQTQELEGTISGQSYRGWDYLRLKLLEKIQADSDLLTVDCWEEMSPERLRELFFDSAKGDTLRDVDGRARLIQDLGGKLRGRGFSHVHSLYELSDATVDSNGEGLLESLRAFKAYSDPVQKKSYFFLGLMRNTGSWLYKDDTNVGAPVDYHEVRGHLRVGTVVLDPIVRRKILAGVTVEEHEDVAIRSAVALAIRSIANQIGATPMQLHYLFWNLFRNICTRERPNCFHVDGICSLPARYATLVSGNACPMHTTCNSAGMTDRIIEHSFRTEWY